MSEKMKMYVGTKFINAKPMTRLEYNNFRGWALPADENGDDAGFLVEYLDGGKANTTEYKGYVSWSPAEVFEKAYHSTDAMSFGDALMALKMGFRVSRAGWNGKGMFVYYVPAAAYPAQRNSFGTLVGVFADDLVPYRDYIAMKTVDDQVVPWVASQSDMLANDWMTVGLE